ncbi:sensor histidine kinase [Leifsonia sp. A12D58]|uniref:sensor histidine kinase n=1 Tax=Leifsonia sp. A12D58 TaxID=3397674 RepID=UPI0039DFF7AA
MPSPTSTEPATMQPDFRRYRATVRTRLALTYSALLTGAGIVMLGIVYLVMRFVPTYDLVASSSSVPASTLAPGTPPSDLESTPDVITTPAPAALTTPASELTITSTDQMLNLLLVISGVVLIVLAVVGIAVGWAVAGRMLKPLQYINSAAHQAARGDLSHRIRLVGPRDEISELAANFDEMLAQLERSFAASRRFAVNASHELLTPLATSRAMLDVAIAQEDSPEERVVFDRLRQMNERSIETVEALLDLAKIDSSSAVPETIDLSDIAAEVADSCAREAAERSVAIRLNLKPALIEAEPVLLRQLLTNLFQNAIRHNQGDARFVEVITRPPADNGGAILEIANSGTVLDAHAVAALTEPFSRAAGRASTASTRGHGLGLSIVAAIVERLRGTLMIEARPTGGLRVVVGFAPTHS